MTRFRRPAQRLRAAVEAMPERTRQAMLRGIRRNRIVAGAYTDPDSGGICPMLAAHRNGGRTDFATFAVAWDEFTGESGARRPRRATRREVGTLLSYLELSLVDENAGRSSLREAVARIRTERREFAARDARETTQPDLAPLTEPAPAVPDRVGLDRDGDPLVERIVDEVMLRR